MANDPVREKRLRIRRYKRLIKMVVKLHKAGYELVPTRLIKECGCVGAKKD